MTTVVTRDLDCICSKWEKVSKEIRESEGNRFTCSKCGAIHVRFSWSRTRRKENGC